MSSHQVVSREKWIAARKEHLAKEKQFTRQRDELARVRRELPWVKVDKNYVFESPRGKVSLADLFEGKSQLIVYHFMFGPEWPEGCPGCSFVSDHIDGMLAHLGARDVSLAVVSRASADKIEAFKKRMGWGFKWVSSNANDFNFDFHVSFKPEHKVDGKVDYNYVTQEFPSEEAPGASFFYKDSNGDIFHTYSTYGRGLEVILSTYSVLDMAPKGRDEDQLARPMQWVRHHDRYNDGSGSKFDTVKLTTPAKSSSSCSCATAEAKS